MVSNKPAPKQVAKPQPKKTQLSKKVVDSDDSDDSDEPAEITLADDDVDSDEDDMDEDGGDFDFGSDSDADEEEKAKNEVNFNDIVLKGDGDDEDDEMGKLQTTWMIICSLSHTLLSLTAVLSLFLLGADEDEDENMDEDDAEEEEEEEEEEENVTKKAKTDAKDELDALDDDEVYDWKVVNEEDEAQMAARKLEQEMQETRLSEKLEKKRVLIAQMIKERQKVARARRVMKRRRGCMDQKLSIKPNYQPHKWS